MPQVYMCSPHILNPSPSLPPHPILWVVSEHWLFELAIYFTYRNVLVSMLFSQYPTPSLSPTESKSLEETDTCPGESEANMVVCEAARCGDVRGRAFPMGDRPLVKFKALLGNPASPLSLPNESGLWPFEWGGNWSEGFRIRMFFRVYFKRKPLLPSFTLWDIG